ncbi:MAG: D-alanyl-D-alanine dipeptidase [Leptolyngbyaceae cyanobacterium CRU_2_3]|nr:D-alanyl-D-alanine dipeptidase [Leptolyngbyaceae cyanobacterium CRU_2_3]
MKPYQQIPIVECREPLLPVPLAEFAVEQPHPYMKLAAPYGEKSPYYLRQGVLECLLQAQAWLQQTYPNWRIQIFDAYRPIVVQQYLVDYAFAATIEAEGLVLAQITDAQRQSIWDQVYQFWAMPSTDPQTPPPHSTGAAVDVSLVDALGHVVEMGSPIDEMSVRSYPHYFAEDSLAQDAFAQGRFAQGIEGRDRQNGLELENVLEGDRATFHAHRQILSFAMTSAGFQQHPREWWHFSMGDQLWAWLKNQNAPSKTYTARYGAI